MNIVYFFLSSSSNFFQIVYENHAWKLTMDTDDFSEEKMWEKGKFSQTFAVHPRARSSVTQCSYFSQVKSSQSSQVNFIVTYAIHTRRAAYMKFQSSRTHGA